MTDMPLIEEQGNYFDRCLHIHLWVGLTHQHHQQRIGEQLIVDIECLSNP